MAKILLLPLYFHFRVGAFASPTDYIALSLSRLKSIAFMLNAFMLVAFYGFKIC